MEAVDPEQPMDRIAAARPEVGMEAMQLDAADEVAHRDQVLGLDPAGHRARVAGLFRIGQHRMQAGDEDSKIVQADGILGALRQQRLRRCHKTVSAGEDIEKEKRLYEVRPDLVRVIPGGDAGSVERHDRHEADQGAEQSERLITATQDGVLRQVQQRRPGLVHVRHEGTDIQAKGVEAGVLLNQGEQPCDRAGQQDIVIGEQIDILALRLLDRRIKVCIRADILWVPEGAQGEVREVRLRPRDHGGCRVRGGIVQDYDFHPTCHFRCDLIQHGPERLIQQSGTVICRYA